MSLRKRISSLKKEDLEKGKVLVRGGGRKLRGLYVGYGRRESL